MSFKKKLLQMTANYSFYAFSGFPACKLLHYRSVKCMLLHMLVSKSVLWTNELRKSLFVEKLHQKHLNCASKTAIFF